MMLEEVNTAVISVLGNTGKDGKNNMQTVEGTNPH